MVKDFKEIYDVGRCFRMFTKKKKKKKRNTFSILKQKNIPYDASLSLNIPGLSSSEKHTVL